MNIVVTVKVVPEKIKFNKETKRIEREGIKNILNPPDLVAAELARKIKIRNGGTLTAISMAPPSAKETLKELFKYGFDRVVLLSDRLFGGADTIATAYVLSEGIKKFIRNFDVVVQGDYSLDGATGQLGGELAALLDVPYFSHVLKVNDDIVTRVAESEKEEFSVKFPALLSIEPNANKGVSTDLFSLLSEEERKVEIYSNEELKADQNRCGLTGSKTSVLSLVQNDVNEGTNLIREDAGKAIVEFLSKVGVV